MRMAHRPKTALVPVHTETIWVELNGGDIGDTKVLFLLCASVSLSICNLPSTASNTVSCFGDYGMALSLLSSVSYWAQQVLCLHFNTPLALLMVWTQLKEQDP